MPDDFVDAEPVEVSVRDAHIAAGHVLIDKHLSRARALGSSYPGVAVLMPVIGNCLHELFTHLHTDPHAAAEAVAAQKAAQEQKPAEEIPITG